MMNWISLPTRTGRAEVKGQLVPTPPGPYFYVLQGDETSFLKDYTGMKHEVKHEFELRFGYSIYAPGSNGEPIRVGYYFDTSD